jgi:hypothetical protein
MGDRAALADARGHCPVCRDSGASGYVALYHYAGEGDVVTVLALGHQREAGYEPGSIASGN